MNWLSAKENVGQVIGRDVLVKYKNGQYMAGNFHRTADSKIQFEDSSGAWCSHLDEIEKFAEIV